MRGRRTKLTPEVLDKITTAIATGVPFGMACRLAGIHPDSGYAWLKRGAHDQTQGRAPTLFSDFSDAVARARRMKRTGSRASPRPARVAP
jgi:hypothetical protein